MDTNARIKPIIAAVAPVTATTSGGDFQQSRASEDAERNARYRLVIEEGPTRGTFIYKSVDRITGEVVRQLPREEVVRMAQSDKYDAGSVIDTKA